MKEMKKIMRELGKGFYDPDEECEATERRRKAKGSERYLRLWRKFRKTGDCGISDQQLYKRYGVFELVDPRDLNTDGIPKNKDFGPWRPPVLYEGPHYDQQFDAIWISEKERLGLKLVRLSTFSNSELHQMFSRAKFDVDLARNKKTIIQIIEERIEQLQGARRRHKLKVAKIPSAKRNLFANKNIAVWLVGVLSEAGMTPKRVASLAGYFPKSANTVTRYKSEYRSLSDGEKQEIKELFIRSSLRVKLPDNEFQKIADKTQHEKWTRQSKG